MRHARTATAYLYLAPNLVGFAIFTLVPVVAALALSLFQWDIFRAPHFVGLHNYWILLGWFVKGGATFASDFRFWQAVGNTLYFMLAIPVSIAASLLLALVLNQNLPGRIFFRTIFFLPTVCAGVGLYLLWKFLAGPAWLTDYYRAKPAIMVMEIWIAMGGPNMLLYLAGMQAIPPDLYEAAEIDGASKWQKFRHITLPLLSPTTFFVVTISIIAGLQGEFDSAYIMTQGGPDGATTSLVYYIYKHAFQWFNMGYAATIAVALFAMVLVVTLAHWRLAGRGVHYV